jgi:small subunit ribosomal protein S15
MLTPQEKKKIIEKFKTHEGDTGSPEVQAALFTKKIENLSEHLKNHPKDNSSRRGLLKIISKRKRIFDFIFAQDEKRFKSLMKKLGIKK